MSDSDDTDILLLIPPNFFLTEESLNASLNYDHFESKLQEKSQSLCCEHYCHSASFQTNPSDSKMRKSPFACEILRKSDLCDDRRSLQYRHFDRSSPPSTTKFTSPSLRQCNYNQLSSSTPFESVSMRNNRSDELSRELSKKVYVDPHFTPSQSETKLRFSDGMNVAFPDSKHIEMNTPTQNITRFSMKPTEDDILKSLTSTKMSDWNSGLQKSIGKNDELIDLTAVWNREENKSKINERTNYQSREGVLREQEEDAQDCMYQQRKQRQAEEKSSKLDQTKNDALKHLHAANAR